ncbi:MAG: LysM peptidoglycan-binding domain-containing protein [Halieaceae bacterium]
MYSISLPKNYAALALGLWLSLCAAPSCFANAAPVAADASTDIWQRIRQGLTLQDIENSRIAAERNWYVKNPEYMARVSSRAAPYLYYVVEEIERRGMPMEFALLPVMESAYDPFAYSHGRAAGLWQIIPGTGRELGLTQDWWYDGRRDVRASTDAALEYLSRLGRAFDGDWLKALAAYNAGKRRVRQAEARNRNLGRQQDFWSLKLPVETRNYVPRLLALTDVVADPQKYGQTLTPVPNSAHFAVIETGSQIDLAQAASLAGLDIDAVYLLNPGFNRWATSPGGPHQLLLPDTAAASFEENLAALDPGQRLQWTRYTVRTGDSLSEISDRFNTEIKVIRDVNKLRNNRIVAGKTLMIPIASAPLEVYALSADQRQAAKQSKGEGNRVEYTVRPGDSFWSIARRFEVSTRKLAEWNGLAVRDPIHPGQTLVVWSKQPVSTSRVTSASTLIPQREPMMRKLGYRVRNGDSLARIAGKFNITIEDIISWNQKLRGKKYIHPGQNLTLYVDVTST